MAPSKISWSKPVTSKLRKKNNPMPTRPKQAIKNTDGDADECINARDSWSVVSASGSYGLDGLSPDEIENMIQDIQELPDELPTPSFSEESVSRSHTRESSGSSDWSFIDVGIDEVQEIDQQEDQDNDQEEVNNPDTLAKPTITIEPPTPNYQEEENISPTNLGPAPRLAQPSDFQGARDSGCTYELSDLDALNLKLKTEYNGIRRDVDDFYSGIGEELAEMQRSRWEIEDKRDELEQRIKEHKELRAQDPEVAAKRLRIQRFRAVLRITDEEVEESRELLESVNTRDRATIDYRGRLAQGSRATYTPPAEEFPESHSEIEGKLASPHLLNHRRDFPYKPWSFIHQDVQSIYDREGRHIGYNHKYEPSCKRRHVPFKLNSRDEMLIEIGKYPLTKSVQTQDGKWVQENVRMKELFKCEHFKHAVSLKSKERKRETKWYTQGQIEDLLGKKEEVQEDVRHDSVQE